MEDKEKLLSEPKEANLFSGTGPPKMVQKTRAGRVGPESSLSAVSMQRRYLVIAVLLVLSCCLYLIIRGSGTHRASHTLVKVFVCFRHGSRAPTWTYEGDMYKNSIDELIPEGREKLTKTGKQEAYTLGKRLRERYDDFLGPMYSTEEVKTYTTLIERTMMSGQLVMASLFPPAGYQLWDQQLHWQPVPLFPDYIFNTTVGSSCPRFRVEAYQGLHNAFTKLKSRQKEAVMYVMKHAGEPDKKPYEVFARVFDTTYFQDKANLPLPDWIKNVFPEKMTEAALELLKGFLVGNEVQRQLLLWNYASALRDFFHSENPKKMEIHSWHDLNNLAMLTLLGVDVTVYPEPTSCVLIELHERRGHQYVEVYYFDSYKSEQPRQLEMGCGLSCSLEKLEEMVDGFRVSDYKKLCHSANITDNSSIPKLKIIM